MAGMTTEHPAERGGTGRDWFAAFSDRASNVTSSPLFYVLCVLLVLGMVAVHLAHLPLPWLIFMRRCHDGRQPALAHFAEEHGTA